MRDMIGQLINDLTQPAGSQGGTLVDNYSRNRAWSLDHPTYNTQLSPQDEGLFRQWVGANKVPFNPDSIVSDYDMRGFWGGLQSGDPLAKQALDPNDNQMHFPDKWKTPYHETFSNQSLYANGKAPDWQGDKLVTQDGKVLFDDQAPKIGAGS